MALSGTDQGQLKWSRPQTVVACPSCGASDLTAFYGAPDLPVHSCLLMPDPTTASRYQRGDLELGLCAACGFITNLRFEPDRLEYSPTYEETQHFSGQFSRFAEALAHQWVNDYKLSGKRILEIGCGKGEFLALFCEIGNNEGIGIDPSAIPERLKAAAASRITLLPEHYSEAHGQLEADAILCRHTLEHIPRTRDFIQRIRRSIDTQTDCVVLFELPDTKRVLTECAFWDIYYEHCSYFTAGSLARLFRAAAFDVVKLDRAYDDQYLLLAARPTAKLTESRLPLEDDLEPTKAAVATFATRQHQVIADWRARIQKLAGDGQRPIIWGAGSKCVAFLTTLGIRDEVDYVVDINPHKQGKFLPGTGHAVCGPEEIIQRPAGAIIVMNPIYTQEIRATLQDMRVNAELIPV